MARLGAMQPVSAVRWPRRAGRSCTGMLSLHTSWDPTNPVFHEAAFREKVIAAGAAENLLQRFYPAYGHTSLIPPSVVVQNFVDMVNWVTTGVKPAS